MGVPTDQLSANTNALGQNRNASNTFSFIVSPRGGGASPTLQLRILLRIGLPIERGGNEILRRDLLAAHVLIDGLDGGGCDLTRMLEHGSVHFSILDGFLRLGLAVEANYLDFACFSGLFDSRYRAQS